MRHTDGMAGLSYGEMLRALKLYSVQGRLLQSDIIQYWKILNGHSCITPSDLFQHPYNSRNRGHCQKLFPPITETDTQKRFFSVCCVALWNSLHYDTVCAPSVNYLKRVPDTCINRYTCVLLSRLTTCMYHLDNIIQHYAVYYHLKHLLLEIQTITLLMFSIQVNIQD